MDKIISWEGDDNGDGADDDDNDDEQRSPKRMLLERFPNLLS